MKKLTKAKLTDVNTSQNPDTRNVLNYILPLFLTMSLFLSACGSGSNQGDESQEDTQEQESEENKRSATATMEPASGSNVSGEVNFTEENGTILFELSVENLTPGEHAVHLHEKGDCSAEDATSAGGHWNPTMKPHGKRGDGNAFHKGDIDNMTVGEDGKGTLSLSVKGWSIGGPDSTNIVGKSVIIHAKADDFTSQPSGNAGDRHSCGVIKQN